MVDKKKDIEENNDELTPEEEAAQAGESVEPGEPSEERIADEDVSGEDVSGEDVSAEDVSGEEVSIDENAPKVVAAEETPEEAVVEEETPEEPVAEEPVAEEPVAEEPAVAARATDVAGEDHVERDSAGHITSEHRVEGVAAFFDHPKHLLAAAEYARDAEYEDFEAFSPFPIHGMDAAMGLGRSWIPWVTMGAGVVGFILANMLQFGMMTFDWPMNIGGKPFAPWPSFVPVMFELSVLVAGVTTVFVMLKAAGCFKKPLIIDPKITDDSFVLWISAKDKKFELGEAIDFLETLNPLEVRKVVKDV